MPPDFAPSNGPPDGDPSLDPALDQAFGSVKGLAAGRFEVFGPLGRDRDGEFAFLARSLTENRLAVLKQEPQLFGDVNDPATLKIIDRLDGSVPAPAGSCPVCQAAFVDWEPACPECGNDIAGTFASGDDNSSPEQLLAAVREAAPGYDVLGTMKRASGGPDVYFARDRSRGTLVALRLEQGDASGRRSGFTVAATRMMRPRLLYGTVGGDARESGRAAGKTPVWTPPLTPRSAARSGGATPAGTGSEFSDATGSPKVCPQCGETFGPELRFCPRDGAGLRSTAAVQDLVGQVIAERYHILGKLGEGGMGRVYLAEHVRMGRRCAVKVMNPILLYDPDSVSRFNREAANASLINHPNVAAIYDFGESDDLVYLAMELVEGESLAALLNREHGLSEPRAIDIALQVADALGAAHELGIVHRDLKPDNIMVAQTRNRPDLVKVVDFGIAKATKGGRQTVTRTGIVVGTPAYMSPEQILGDALDGRSDLYSLGCIVYEMLTGERAFADASGEVSIGQRLTQPPPRPGKVKRGLASRLDALVTTAMARAPDQRFQSAAEFRDALSAALRESSAPGSWLDRLPWRRSKGSSGAAGATSPGSSKSATGGSSSRGRAASGSAPGASGLNPPAPGADPGGSSAGGVSTGGPSATDYAGRASSRPPIPAVTYPDQGEAPAVSATGTAGQGRQDAPGQTTVFRHRSARSSSPRAVWLAAGCLAAAALGYGGWKVVTGRPRVSEPPIEAGSKIVLSKPDLSRPSPGPVADTGRVLTTTPTPPVPVPVATGMVRFAVPLPPDAVVRADGAELEPSADGSFPLSAGRHLLQVEAPGYRPMTQSVNVASGAVEVVKARLVRSEPAPRQEPSPRQEPAAGAGAGAPRAEPASRPKATPQPEPAPPPAAAPTPALTTGTIIVAGALPTGTEMSLDGVTLSVGTREIPTSPGSHWMKLSAQGYRTDSARVEVKPGEESRWMPFLLNPAPSLAVVEMATSDTALSVGGAVQLRASLKDDGGATLDRPLVWESSNAAVARVDRGGRVTAVAAGRAYIRARVEGRADSTRITVLRPAAPGARAPSDTAPSPDVAEVAPPANPAPADMQAAIGACAEAFGSQDERRIVEVYQAKTADDVQNLRKLLDVALKSGAEFSAIPVEVGAMSATTPTSLDAKFRFNWRNNAGVNKKKDAAMHLNVARGPKGWHLASCRATDKLSF